MEKRDLAELLALMDTIELVSTAIPEEAREGKSIEVIRWEMLYGFFNTMAIMGIGIGDLLKKLDAQRENTQEGETIIKLNFEG